MGQEEYYSFPRVAFASFDSDDSDGMECHELTAETDCGYRLPCQGETCV